MRERRKKTGFLRLFALAVVLLYCGVAAEGTMVYFPSTDIGGGIIGTAEAEVTSGAGYLDVLLTNTSALGPELASGQRANPFIMEIELAFDDGLTLDEGSSYVSSLTDSLFAQGQGNAAVNYAARNLYYNLVAPDSPGMQKCFMTASADNIRNDNTVGSINVLDGSNVPQENYAVGFLNTQPDQYSGTVFDSVLFHFAFNESVVPDTSFYLTEATLYVKYVGGGDYSEHVASVPEPATFVLFCLGGIGLVRRRGR